jgi:hypothetical protein
MGEIPSAPLRTGSSTPLRSAQEDTSGKAGGTKLIRSPLLEACKLRGRDDIGTPNIELACIIIWRDHMRTHLCIFALLLSVTCLGLPNDADAKVESWYTYWGLGYANAQYPDEVEDALNMLEDLPGVSHISISLDILGFYFTLSNKQTIVGGILNGAGDRYSKDDNYMQLTLTSWGRA